VADMTRRRFLTRTSVGLGLTLAGTSALTATSVHAQERDDLPTSMPAMAEPFLEPMLVHVRDAAAGQVTLLVGTSELVYRDPLLVARLVEAARRADRTDEG
jgi:hypothetical protein